MTLWQKALGSVGRLRLAREERSASEVDRDRAAVKEEGLRAFTRLAWRWIEPLDFVPGWHLDMIAEHLEAVTRGQLRRLVLNIPPGCMKSISVCVMWPAWVWAEPDPAHKFIFTSYADSNSRRDAVRARTLVESTWFKDRWPVRIAREVTRSAALYFNSHGGFRFSTSINGQITGKHGDTQVADDPIDPKRVTHKKQLQACLDFWNTTMPTRQANPKTGRRVIVMQRLHDLDLSGAMAREGGYEFVTLPMEFDPKRRCFTFEQKLTDDGRIVRAEDKPIGADLRETEGELLWPQRYDAPTVKEIRRALGPTAAAAQLDQSPLPLEGAIFKPKHFLQRYSVRPHRFDFVAQSWDMRFKKENDSGDYVVGGTWGAVGSAFYLLDVVRGRWSLSQSIAAVLDLGVKWTDTRAVLIENKANGAAVEDQIGKKVAGVLLVEPKGGKVARANACEPILEAGNVYWPDDMIAPWMNELRTELLAFPKGTHDDQVDMVTQALTWLASASRVQFGEAWRAALAEMQAGQKPPALPPVVAQPIVDLRPEIDSLAAALQTAPKAG